MDKIAKDLKISSTSVFKLINNYNIPVRKFKYEKYDLYALYEKYALDERIHCLFRQDRWDEILNMDEKMRDMQQRYPREQIGASCQTIARIASIHAMRGDLDLAVIQRNEAQAIMTAISGSFEQWVRDEHY